MFRWEKAAQTRQLPADLAFLCAPPPQLLTASHKPLPTGETGVEASQMINSRTLNCGRSAAPRMSVLFIASTSRQLLHAPDRSWSGESSPEALKTLGL